MSETYKPLDLLEVPLGGVHLIEASAGTGKTYSLIALYVRLLVEKGLELSGILAVTFTVAATEELRERLRARLEALARALRSGSPPEDPFAARLIARTGAARALDRVEAALSDFDQAPVYTIHSFANRCLEEFAFESGGRFESELEGDGASLVEEVAADYWRRTLVEADRGLLDLLSGCKIAGPEALARFWSERRRRSEAELRVRFPLDGAPSPNPVEEFVKGFFEYAARELRRRRFERGTRTFDDLVLDLRDLLRSGPPGLLQALRNRYRAALIDEFQDTDPVQYDIFKRIFIEGGAALFLIGDPKQAIYSFRGADVFSYLQAAREAPDRRTLLENYRSGERLIEGVNRLFSAGERPFGIEAIGFRGARKAEASHPPLFRLDGGRPPPFALRLFAGGAQRIPRKEAAVELAVKTAAADIAALLSLAAEGRALLDDRPVSARDIAVLTRKNDEAEAMRRALADRGVPAVLQTPASVFASDEAEDLARVLDGFLHPHDDRRLRGLLATRVFGAGASELQRLGEDESAWEERVERILGYAEAWRRHGFLRMFEELLRGERVRPRLLAEKGGERRLTNLVHMAELLHRAESDERLSPAGLAAWLDARRREAAGGGPAPVEEHEMRLETDASAVQIVTGHKAKGLEFPIVYCPFFWAASSRNRRGRPPPVKSFHTGPPDYRSVLVFGALANEEKELAALEALSEELRLLYVALTRAKSRLVLYWAFAGSTRSDAVPGPLEYLLLERMGGTGGGPPSRLADGALLENALRRLAAEAPGVFEIVEGPPPEAASLGAPAAERAELKPPSFSGVIRSDWRIASFSWLISGRPQAAELPDRDAEVEGGVTEPEAASEEVEGRTIFSFPRGARAGSCLHEIFERVPYDLEPRKEVEASIEGALLRYGFETAWRDTLEALVERTLHAPLEPVAPGFRLGDLPRNRRFHELEFHLPLSAITQAELARRLKGLGGSETLNAALDSLGFDRARGYLKGYIDLVFAHEGRWWIADWKSNHLGASPENYAPERLHEVMHRELYALQYLLYTVGLDRFLTLRLPGYDYERSFGGVLYLFLRGIGAGADPGLGVFFARPDRRAVAELREAFFTPPSEVPA